MNNYTIFTIVTFTIGLSTLSCAKEDTADTLSATPPNSDTDADSDEIEQLYFFKCQTWELLQNCRKRGFKGIELGVNEFVV